MNSNATNKVFLHAKRGNEPNTQKQSINSWGYGVPSTNKITQGTKRLYDEVESYSISPHKKPCHELPPNAPASQLTRCTTDETKIATSTPQIQSALPTYKKTFANDRLKRLREKISTDSLQLSQQSTANTLNKNNTAGKNYVSPTYQREPQTTHSSAADNQLQKRLKSNEVQRNTKVMSNAYMNETKISKLIKHGPNSNIENSVTTQSQPSGNIRTIESIIKCNSSSSSSQSIETHAVQEPKQIEDYRNCERVLTSYNVPAHQSETVCTFRKSQNITESNCSQQSLTSPGNRNYRSTTVINRNRKRFNNSSPINTTNLSHEDVDRNSCKTFEDTNIKCSSGYSGNKKQNYKSPKKKYQHPKYFSEPPNQSNSKNLANNRLENLRMHQINSRKSDPPQLNNESSTPKYDLSKRLSQAQFNSLEKCDVTPIARSQASSVYSSQSRTNNSSLFDSFKFDLPLKLSRSSDQHLSDAIPNTPDKGRCPLKTTPNAHQREEQFLNAIIGTSSRCKISTNQFSNFKFELDQTVSTSTSHFNPENEKYNINSNTSEQINSSSSPQDSHKIQQTAVDMEDMDWSEIDLPADETESPSRDNSSLTEATEINSSEKVKSTKSQDLCIVVDTNVFLKNLNIIRELTKFKDGTVKPIVYVPWMVLNELDFIKDDKCAKSSLKTLAQNAIKFINVMLLDGNERVVGQNVFDMDKQKDIGKSPDDKILACCMQACEKYENVILLSNDINLKNKALISSIDASSPSEILIRVITKWKKNQRINKILNKMSLCCSYIICECAKGAYGTVWNQMESFKCPPWSLQSCLKTFVKYWSAVFSEMLLKQFLTSVKNLSLLLNNINFTDDTEEFQQFTKLCMSVCIFLKDIDKYKGTVERTIRDINLIKNS